jgi:hypothetical protein
MRTARIVLAALAAACVVGTVVIVAPFSWRTVYPACPAPESAEASALLSRLERIQSIRVVEDQDTTFDMQLRPTWAYHETLFNGAEEWISRGGVTYARDVRDPRWISFPTARMDRSDMNDYHVDPGADLLWRRMCGARVEASGSEQHLHGFEPRSVVPPQQGLPIDVWVGPDGCPTRGSGLLRLADGAPDKTVDYRFSLCNRVSPTNPPPATERRGPLAKLSGDVRQRIALAGSAVTATSATQGSSVAGPQSTVVELQLENFSGVPLAYDVDDRAGRIEGCGWLDDCSAKPDQRIFLLHPNPPRSGVLGPGQTLAIGVAVAETTFTVHVQIGNDEATVRV